MTGRSIDEIIDAIDDVLLTASSLARDLTEQDAELATECPGWTVRDQLAHMVGLEQVLSGTPHPDIELPPLDHVSSEIDVYMEQQVHVRRQLALGAIADEMAGLRPRRVSELRRLAAEGDQLVAGPFGERLLSASLPLRAFDLWAHEQDIRRAVGLPVRTDCSAAELALERSLLGWSAALPTRLGIDAELVISMPGSNRSETRVVLGDGGTTVALTGDLGQLTRWFCGRSGPTDADVTGDPALVEAVRHGLAMTP